MTDERKFEIGDIITDPLRVEYITEFDSGYSRKSSFRITFSDDLKNRFEWETSGKFNFETGDIVSDLKLKVKKTYRNYDGKLIVVLKR